MTSKHDFEIPYLIRRQTVCTLRLLDESLIGSKRHILRLDLYPLVAPSYMMRHYGWWDIPLSKVRTNTVELSFAPFLGVVTLPGRVWSYKIKRSGGKPLNEAGYCSLHVSIWDISRNNTRMIDLASYPVVLLRDSADLPLKGFNIPVTDRCNLKCGMCPRQWTEQLVERDIPEDMLQSLIATASHVKSVLTQGLGEPLLYKDLFTVIRQLKVRMPPEGQVGLTTNGSLLNREVALDLLEAGPDFLYFSMDAAFKATYETNRPGADFQTVVENIKRCSDLRRRSGKAKPAFMMNFVIMENNYGEILQFVNLAAQLCVESITFSRCLSTSSGHDQAIPEATLQRLFDEAKSLGTSHGMNVFVPPVTPANPGRCLFLERAVVLTTGDVLPCHAMAPGYTLGTKARIFGNVREKPLLEIWNQPDFQQFRRQALEGDFPLDCDGCECKRFLVP